MSTLKKVLFYVVWTVNLFYIAVIFGLALLSVVNKLPAGEPNPLGAGTLVAFAPLFIALMTGKYNVGRDWTAFAALICLIVVLRGVAIGLISIVETAVVGLFLVAFAFGLFAILGSLDPKRPQNGSGQDQG